MNILQATCSKCNNIYPLTSEHWHKDKRGRKGFSYSCKECANRRANKWHHENIERANETSRNWYANNPDKKQEYNEQNKDRIREWKRAWRKANPEKVKQHRRESQKRHRASANRRIKRYAERHPKIMRLRSQISYEKYKYREGLSNDTVYHRLEHDQEGRCGYCGIILHDDFHIDHMTPLTKGGTNDYDNLVLCCPNCNSSKADDLIDDWKKRRGW